MSEHIDQKQRPSHLFKPGQSGNPKGRPKGARSRLGEEFLKDMLADWELNGKDVIEAVREHRPDQYLKVVASILPKDLNLKVNPLEEATDDELVQRLRELHAAIEPVLGPVGSIAGSGGDSEGTGPKKAH